MKCPICPDVNLAMTDRQGIEIDYCPQCRGVWLDRGELDKLIENASTASAQPQEQPNVRSPQYNDRYSDDHYKHKRKKSLLGELFEY